MRVDDVHISIPSIELNHRSRQHQNRGRVPRPEGRSTLERSFRVCSQLQRAYQSTNVLKHRLEILIAKYGNGYVVCIRNSREVQH